MRQVFVLKGERLELKVEYIRTHPNLIEVTSFSDSWRKWIDSGQKRLELSGKTADGREIQGTFEVVSQTVDGAIHIKSCVDDSRP